MPFLSFFSDYYIWIIAGAILLSYFIIDLWVKPKMQAKKTKELLEKIAVEFGYSLSEDKHGDYKMENDDRVLFWKAVYVPDHSTITVNNRFTLCLSYGGIGSRLQAGKAYPQKRYLSEIEEFLKWVAVSEKPCLKVVLVCSSTEKVQKYLNESEIAIVKTGELVYDYKLITADRLSEDFRLL